MDAAWLYEHMGTLAQSALFGALIIVGVVVLLRKRKGKRLDRTREGVASVSDGRSASSKNAER